MANKKFFVLNVAGESVEFEPLVKTDEGYVEQLPKNVTKVIFDLANEFGMFVFANSNECFLSLVELIPDMYKKFDEFVDVAGGAVAYFMFRHVKYKKEPFKTDEEVIKEFEKILIYRGCTKKDLREAKKRIKALKIKFSLVEIVRGAFVQILINNRHIYSPDTVPVKHQMDRAAFCH